MVEFVTPTREIEVEAECLEFRDLNTGIVFYPDGDILIYWGRDDDYDERKINLFKEKTYYNLWNFIYDFQSLSTKTSEK